MIIDYDYLASEFAKCYKDKSRIYMIQNYLKTFGEFTRKIIIVYNHVFLFLISFIILHTISLISSWFNGNVFLSCSILLYNSSKFV